MAIAKYIWAGKGKWRSVNAYPATRLTLDLKVDFESCRSVIRFPRGKIHS